MKPKQFVTVALSDMIDIAEYVSDLEAGDTGVATQRIRARRAIYNAIDPRTESDRKLDAIKEILK